MKKYSNYPLVFALLFFVFVVNSTAQTASLTANHQLEIWKTFAPAGKNFRVAMPAEPEELGDGERETFVSAIKSQVKKSAADLAVFDNVSVYNLDTRWNGFGILVFDYKWQKLDFDEKSGVLTLSSDKVSDEIALHEWWEFEKAKRLSGEVFIVDRDLTRDGKKFKSRAVVTKNKVYLLMVGMPDLYSATPELARVYQTEADTFFNSFQILDNKPQIARQRVENRRQ